MRCAIATACLAVFSGFLSGVAPVASAAPPAAAEAGTFPGYPVPPQQTQPWEPPQTSLPAPVITAAARLFEQGFADPRGLAYREVTIETGSVWGSLEQTRTHAWVITNTPFAVAWNGLVYRTLSTGAAADVEADVRALLAADEAARAKADPHFGYHRFSNSAEAYFVDIASVTPVKAMLLLRLGDGELAERVWYAATDGSGEPFTVAAADWLWTLFDRAITAHMLGDTGLALESLQPLAAQQGAAAAEIARRGGRPEALEFLGQVSALLADERRRAAHPAGLDSAGLAALLALPQPQRIAGLIDALDQVAARQWGQPGGVALGQDPIVMALIGEGEAAVPALLEAYEHDDRLTCSVQFWRDFARHRSVLTVYEAAYVALSGILDESFFQPATTGDNLTARGDAGRAEVGARLRAYWNRWKAVPLLERYYDVLADDAAGSRQWVAAAQNIATPSNVQSIASSSIGQMAWITEPPPGEKPMLRGEPLRAKTSPPVSALLARRLAAASGGDACTIALAFTAWDRAAALPHVAALVTRTIAGYAAAPDRENAGQCIAALTTERVAAGDGHALADYAGWIVHTVPDEASYSFKDWFAPMIRNPGVPAMQRAADALFAPGSPWVPFHTRFEGERLLALDLYPLAAFRAHVISKLRDQAKIGTVKVGENGLSIETGVYTSSQSIDTAAANKPPVGTTQDLRVCDAYAQAIAGSGLHAPPFQMFWPRTERDRAIEALIRWVRARA
jgi:hypothetical protein